MPEGRVAVVGSGFAGSILARILRRLGCEVLLLERLSHPRFALGESSTPLGGFCLERLAARYGLEDLHDLAAYGRWMARMPAVRRGLKRGFTFYHHQPGRDFDPGRDNRNRLLVAASPEDALADSHWLREDVDRFLAERAVAEGVELRERCEVIGVEEGPDGYLLDVESVAEGRRRVAARFVVDATGPRGAVGAALGAGRRTPAARFRSGLVWGHVEKVGAVEEEIALEPGPYPDRRAAMHHLLEEGWVYVLEFDDGRASVGLILDRDAFDARVEEEPAAVWDRVLSRYPTLERQLAGARPLWPLAELPLMQYRRRLAAAGSRRRAWALLPHAYAFFDPMYSTGIAWSLLGVERLARAFEDGATDLEASLARYGRLLALEAEQIERLIAGAYLARREPRAFTAQSLLYFAAVSRAELAQRLFDEEREKAVWSGFLGAGQPGWESLFVESVARLAGLARTPAAARHGGVEGFERWIASSIAPHDVIGLADPERRNLHPVDLERVLANAPLLGVDAKTLRGLLPRLRGGAGASPSG